jgi:hypothetical protein
MAEFHGPTAVIGKNSTDDYVDLETNYPTNVEWVVKTKNATFLPNTNKTTALGAQVHTNNQEGEFVLMAIQHSAGLAGTSKIVVSGESIASSYKSMFNPTGEYDIPHNDYFLVFNTFQWLHTIHLRPVNPSVHLLTPMNNDKTDGLLEVTWTVPQFHAPSYTFDVYVNGSVHDTTVGNKASLNLTSGAYEIFVQEESLQGFVSRSTTVLVYIDVDAPVVTITAPTNNKEFTVGTGVDVTWEATDIGQGLASFELLLDNTSNTNISDTSVSTHKFTGLAIGTHTITVKATDALGNVGQATVSVVIKAAPVTTSSTSSVTPSPGFEALLFLAVLPVYLIFRKKNKNN